MLLIHPLLVSHLISLATEGVCSKECHPNGVGELVIVVMNGSRSLAIHSLFTFEYCQLV